MRVICLLTLVSLYLCSCTISRDIKKNNNDGELVLTKDELLNKIKGGWAGQTIGVTYGGPTEFKFNGKMIPDEYNIPWYDGYLKEIMLSSPWLYDDIYMDITFVEIIERLGIDAPLDSFANAFAYAPYKLWHANQAARRNILDGISPKKSGHWKLNPHADDIDYQIEADYSGLMSPGMPNTASNINDKIGHMVTYGDGWYGGVYVGALYSLAFVSNDINFIVNEALKVIPAKSRFYECIADVIKWHKMYPNDWKQTWRLLEEHHADDLYCPEGYNAAYNIDARINSAYVVLGLLYGQGDFSETIYISTRAGQDSDCNPSTAAGILGTMHGYEAIPKYWKQGLKDIEDIHFLDTHTSLNRLYLLSYNHAIDNIKKNGGIIGDNIVKIRTQKPKEVRYERSFPDLLPTSKVNLNKKIVDDYKIEFEGNGIVISAEALKDNKNLNEHELIVEVILNGKHIDNVIMPTDFITRRLELYTNYELPQGKHTIVLKPSNKKGYSLKLTNYITYNKKD